MVIETRPRIADALAARVQPPKAQICLFHCFNALGDTSFLDGADYRIQDIKLPCSSMLREVVLLRAFEAGADTVVVLACPEGSCHYLQGNLRAAKRVARVKKILDEIGLDGRRLNIHSIPHGDQSAANRIIEQTVADLVKLGPNPAV